MSVDISINTERDNIKLNLISLQGDVFDLQKRFTELRDYADMKGERVAWFDDLDCFCHNEYRGQEKKKSG